MKLFAYRENGVRCLGIIHNGKHCDLTQALKQRNLPGDESALLAQGFFQRSKLTNFLQSNAALREICEPISWDIPFARASKILAIGKNFAAHAAEFGSEAPKEPMFFGKFPNCFLPHGATIQIPYWLLSRVDHEAELAMIIGKAGKNIPESQAFGHVGGYTVLNDVTARKMQGDDRKEGYPWLRSKSLDTSAPCGPYWVPSDFISDPKQLVVSCKVNGELRQKAPISEMVHPIPKIISYLSKFMRLEVGDLISLGTPSGVGPIVPGDIVECEVSGIGLLSNPVVREKMHHGEFADKEKLFTEFHAQWEKQISKTKTLEEKSTRTIQLLHDSIPYFHWTGIYWLKNNALILGPYRGKPTEHTTIAIGQGICGRAVAENQTIVVDDVTQESNYLACSIETRSEIVVPLYSNGNIIGEIDIDSNIPKAFDQRDKEFLESVGKKLIP